MPAILLAGQSWMDRLWQTPSTGEPSAAANTYLWSPGSPGSWGAPVNSLIRLTNRLASNIGKEVRIFSGAQEGSSLFQAGANAGSPTWWWLNETDATSPLVTSLTMIAQAGVGLDAVVFLEGQGETRPAAGVTTAAYLAGLCKLHATIAIAVGRSPDQMPFVIVPINSGDTQLQAVLKAQYTAAKFPGMVLGPDMWDLPVDPLDPPHLTQAGRDTLAERIADALTPILLEPTYIPQVPNDASFTLNYPSSGQGLATNRIIFSPGLFSGRYGSRVRLTMRASDLTACTWDEVYFGPQSSGPSAASLAQILFGGNPSTGIVAAGQEIVSDWLAIPIIPSSGYVASYHTTSGSEFNTATGQALYTDAYYKLSADEAAVASVSGFNQISSRAPMSVSKVEWE